MKTIVCLMFTFALAASAGAGPDSGSDVPSNATSATASATSSLLPARVMQAAHERVAVGEYPMLVIGVVKGDRSRLYGFNAKGDPAPTADSIFEIGSVTKTFTGLALAEAIKRGDLALDDPVEKPLPEFDIPSYNGKKITLADLADQHSGLPRMPDNFKPSNWNNPYAGYDLKKLRHFLAHYTLPREPGSAYQYSNVGFGLLGYALAQQADASYGTLMKNKILEPLNMHECGVQLNKTMRENLVPGHDTAGKVTPNWDFAVLAGAGAIKCSAADMMRYLKANMGVVDTPLYSAMQLAHEPRADGPGKNRVGLGWMTLDTGDTKIIWHNGKTGGYASFIGFTADGRQGVFVLTNVARSPDDLGFATLVEGAKLWPATIHMAPEKLDDYVGYYRLAHGFLFMVFRRQDRLYAEITGQGAFRIYPKAMDEFFARHKDTSLGFRRGENDKVTELVLHRKGDKRAPKVDAAKAAETIGKHLVPLDTSILKDYVGRYRLATNKVFSVTLENGRLYVRLTGQAAMPVYPSAKDEFFYLLINAELSFERDEKGDVTALILHQGGIDQKAIRSHKR